MEVRQEIIRCDQDVIPFLGGGVGIFGVCTPPKVLDGRHPTLHPSPSDMPLPLRVSSIIRPIILVKISLYQGLDT